MSFSLRTAIYGAGAMGTVLGAHLARAGAQVELITRNAAHVEALNAHGAHITGTVDFVQPVTALTPDKMAGKYGVIFLMTKQRENAKTAEFLLPYLADGGVICTLQNGLPEDSVAAIIGKDRTLGCALSWGATFVKAGEVKLTSSPDKLTFALGSTFGDNPALLVVQGILQLMGKVEIVENFIGARFAKLAVNSAFSSLSALSGLTFGEVAKNKTTRPLALALLREAFTVAEAAGIKIEPIQGHDIVKIYGRRGALGKKLAYMLLPLAMKSHKDIVSGMFYDLQAGRKCDMDFINGAVASLGFKHGAKTPLNDKVLALCKQVEDGALKQGPDILKSL